MRYLIVTFLLTLSLACTGPAPKVIGHRGCRLGAPYENTISSLRYAIDVGVDAVEFDVQLTSDDSVIVFHGPVVPGSDRDIRTITFLEARSVALPGGERMPTLKEWFEEAAKRPDVSLIMEIKKQLSDERTLLLVHKALGETKLSGANPAFTSFSTLALDEIRRLEPSAKLIYLQSGTPVKTAAWAKERGYDGLSYNLDGFMNNPEIIEEARELGIETTLWLVNDYEVADWAVRHGVDYISSDYPAMHTVKRNRE